MFFKQDNISFMILDVLTFENWNYKSYNYERNFDSISLRYEADTVIEYNGKQMEFGDNSIGFFPADTDYIRTSRHDKVIAILFKTFNYNTNDIEKFVPQDIGKYQILFEKALKCWNEKNPAYKHETSSILNLIFAEMYKDNKKEYTSDSAIALSVKYIQENCLKKDFSLTEAASKSHISEQYFRKLFKAEFGIPPKKYIIRKRIKRAASLIITGSYTLEEISSICGYNDYKHFSVEFKKITGVSPSGYACREAKSTTGL